MLYFIQKGFVQIDLNKNVLNKKVIICLSEEKKK